MTRMAFFVDGNIWFSSLSAIGPKVVSSVNLSWILMLNLKKESQAETSAPAEQNALDLHLHFKRHS